MLISGHLQTVKILISRYHSTAKTLISLREQWKVHFTQHVSSIERPRVRMCPIFFSLKSNMARSAPHFACQFVYTCTQTALHLFPLVSVAYSRNKVCKKKKTTLACHGPRLLELLCYTILLALFFLEVFSNADFNS